MKHRLIDRLALVQVSPKRWIVATISRETTNTAPGTPQYTNLSKPIPLIDALKTLDQFEKELTSLGTIRAAICAYCHTAVVVTVGAHLSKHGPGPSDEVQCPGSHEPVTPYRS